MIHRQHIGPATVIVVLLATSAAHAETEDELAAFQLAMNAYDTGEYETAEDRFRELLQRDPPLKNKALVFEIHKYLGATLMFLGRTEEAEEQFEALLRADPEYELDPVLFPTEVLDTFTQVKIRIADELAAIQAEKAQEEEAAQASKEAKKKALKKKIEDAARPVYLTQTVKERALLFALVPFGVGQFQNGQTLKGWLFFAGEMALLATNLTLYGLTEHFRKRAQNTLSTRYINTAENYWTATNVVAGATVAAILAGIIDAVVYYARAQKTQASWEVVEEKDVPEEVRPTPPEFPMEDLDVLLGFTFTWRM